MNKYFYKQFNYNCFRSTFVAGTYQCLIHLTKKRAIVHSAYVNIPARKRQKQQTIIR